MGVGVPVALRSSLTLLVEYLAFGIHKVAIAQQEIRRRMSEIPRLRGKCIETATGLL